MDNKDHYRVLSAIKRTFSRSRTALAARQAAKYPRKKGPRGGAQFKCSDCNKPFGQKGIQVDHIEPVVPIGKTSREMTWDELVDRLYCDIENLQVLCTKCHKKKSAEERSLRQDVKRQLKDGDS